MDIKKGKIKNISKKIVSGALLFTLITVPFASCNSISINDIKYSTNENGTIQGIKGSVDYKTLTYCSFYIVYNNQTNEKYYTIALRDDWSPTFYVSYHDIFTKEQITPDKFGFKSISSVEDYLIEFEMVKREYTEEELKELLNKFVEVQGKNKKLVKE